jgi:ribonuclease J
VLIRICSVTIVPLETGITFYGGVHEIGGNKFLVEDKGTRIFLDFGMQMGKANLYFGEFLQPRNLNGMGDLFEFDLLPRLSGLYRQDYAKHMNFDVHNGKKEPEFDAIVLTHAHLDHAAYLHYIRPDIPVYCSEASRMILQALQDTGSNEEYLTFKRKFEVRTNNKGERVRVKGEDSEEPRKVVQFRNDNKSLKIDSIEVEPLPVDHSVPGVCGLVVHTSRASIAYTADLRFHGRRGKDTQRFVDHCKKSDIDVLLCEGTRVTETSSRAEADVEQDVKEIVNKTKGLVVCSYPARDLDRLLSFYNAAKETDRDLIIDMKQAYALKLFQTSEAWKGVFPKPTDKRIKIYIPRKNWGLIDKDRSYYSERIVEQDYDTWERDFLGYSNAVTFREVSSKQKELIFYCSDYQLHQLIDVRPTDNSSYIRSSTEPFNDEMALKEERVKRWLVHFGLLDDWEHSHVSGHGSGDQIKQVIEGSCAETVIPIHTEHEEYHKKWHQNVREAAIGQQLLL